MRRSYTLADRRRPLRELVSGPRPGPERILYHGLWFKGHNNPRYAELLPRLDRLDPFLIVCSASRVVRGLQYRALALSRRLRYRLVLAAAASRYGLMLTTDNEQIPHFPGRIVSDVDDPKYTPREVRLLNSPQVAAYVVTAERAAKRFEELGVRKPYHVIPQGVSLSSLSPAQVADVRARYKRDGELVVGYMAAFLLNEGDRGGDNPLYNVDHLLDLWSEIARRVPEARLWLIGSASERVRRRCADRPEIQLFGLVPRESVLSYAANFDIALYPRTKDQGIQAAKVAEYMGVGVPTVSYDFAVTEVLRETGGGLLVESPREFVEAVERLARDEAERRRFGEAARRAGAALDWDVLARRYETEILDRHLTAAPA